jgi:RNA polymerase sigma-70 factor (ECF subfamily)
MDDFGEFYAARKDGVLRAVLVATGDRAGAEDAVAEAFTRAYARWRQVDAHPSPTAWVVRVALNAHRSWWRRLRREVPGGAGGAGDRRDEAGAAGVDGRDFGGLNGAGGLDVDLRRLVGRLPTRQREVVALRLLADLSADDTAAVLGIAPATVHVHLHRALASLRASLRPPQPVGTEDAQLGEGGRA